MNAYLASVLENVRTKHGNEPEFVQTVEEVLSSLEPVIEHTPSTRRSTCWAVWLSLSVCSPSVLWCDDNGQWHTNRG